MKKMLLIMLLPILQGCAVGTVVGVATDVAIEAAKVPFKVGGAAIDVVLVMRTKSELNSSC